MIEDVKERQAPFLKHPATSFRRGAVALIDALGFKGVWRDPEAPNLDALGTLKAVQEAVRDVEVALRETLARLPIGFDKTTPQVETHFMSDTVVIAASLPNSDHEDVLEEHLPADPANPSLRMTQSGRRLALDDLARVVVCECVAHAMSAASQGPRPLAYRGVVCVGRFLIDQPFLVGPATDEAASLIDQAEGAFVWLAPSARRAPRMFHLSHDRSRQIALLTRFAVPMKGGQSYFTECINPSGACETIEDARLTRRAILDTMGSDRLDVAIKYQNTRRFFSKIRADEEAALRKASRAQAKRDKKTSVDPES